MSKQLLQRISIYLTSYTHRPRFYFQWGPWNVREFLKLLSWIFREIWHIFITLPWNHAFAPWIWLVPNHWSAVTRSSRRSPPLSVMSAPGLDVDRIWRWNITEMLYTRFDVDVIMMIEHISLPYLAPFLRCCEIMVENRRFYAYTSSAFRISRTRCGWPHWNFTEFFVFRN